jgi:ribosomal protein L32
MQASFLEVARDVAYDEPERKDWLRIYNAFPHNRKLDPVEVDYLFAYDIPEPQWISASREVWLPSEMNEGHLVHTYRFVHRRYAPRWGEHTARLRRWWLMWFERDIMRRHQEGQLTRDSKDLYVSAATQSACPTCKKNQMSNGVCQHCARLNEDRYINAASLWRWHVGFHFPQECAFCNGPLSRTLWCSSCQQYFRRGRWLPSDRDPLYRR